MSIFTILFENILSKHMKNNNKNQKKLNLIKEIEQRKNFEIQKIK